MKLQQYLFNVILIMPLWSCNDRSQNKTIYADINKLADTIIMDIPVDNNGKFLSYYAKKKEIESKINLPSLEGGADSMEIRIWYGIAFSDSLNLVVLKKINLCGMLIYSS